MKPEFVGPLPPWAECRMSLRVEVGISLRERLRLLWSGRLDVIVKVNCEVDPARIESDSTVFVYGFRRGVPTPLGLAEPPSYSVTTDDPPGPKLHVTP